MLDALQLSKTTLEPRRAHSFAKPLTRADGLRALSYIFRVAGVATGEKAFGRPEKTNKSTFEYYSWSYTATLWSVWS